MQPTDAEISRPEPPTGPEPPIDIKRRSTVRKMLSALNGWHAVPAVIIALYLVVGIFGPTLAPFEPNRGTVANRLCPPLAIDALTIAQDPASRSSDCSANHILGTDHNGRDIFSRLLHGARTSLLIVGPSVFVGVVLGAVVGAVINGWRRRGRLIAYLIASVTFVPFGILLLSEPLTLYVFGVIHSGAGGGNDEAWSAFVALSSATAVITLAIVAIAYRFDDTSRSSWFSTVGSDNSNHGFCRQLRIQLFSLAPWVALAALSSAALVFFRSGTTSVQNAATTWAYEPDYLFEHIGMISPLMPMVLVPISFVSLATWWVVHHILCRFKSNSMTTPATEISIDDAASARRRRLLLAIIGIVVAIAITRFAVAEAVPIVRELAQDWTGDYQSGLAQSVQGRIEASHCANELSSRLSTLRWASQEQLEIDAGQRCLDLYFQHRNAPTHRLTFDFALRFATQVVTLGLVGCIVSAALWTVASASSNAIRRIVGVCVALVALIGLTITFGYHGWLLAVSRWFDPVNLALSDQGLAISRAVNIVRDLTVALGISYLTIAIAKPSFLFDNAMPKVDTLAKWAAFVVPCVLLTAGLLAAFHYRFPANLLFIDDTLAVIADPTADQTYISSGSLIRDWLWTYWFAVIGYAAIVFGFLYAGIYWLNRFANEKSHPDEVEAWISPAASLSHRPS